MSKYTTELRHIINNGNTIFDFEYEFYQADKKEEFQQHFIKHFFFREIGLETLEMFKRYLELKFLEILPYYNEMFRTISLTYDPLINYDIVEKTIKDNTGNVSKDLTGKVTNISDGTITENNSLSEKQTIQNETKDTGTITDNGNTTATTSDTNTSTGVINKSHSDTPQGSTSITSTSFVSQLDRDDTTGNSTNESTTEGTITNTTTNDLTKNQTGETNTTNTGIGETNTAQNQTTDTLNKILENTTGNENIDRTVKGINGSITATELIERHLQLQRKLKTVELQFFEECNDLFILLW